MNKKDFLDTLKVALSGLHSEEVQDILRDQEEFIREAVSAGRSETDVLNSLGNPIELAKNLKAEFKIEKASEQIKKAEEQMDDKSSGNKSFSKNVSAMMSAVGAVLLLAPFNLIFVLGPLLAAIGIFMAGWSVSIAISVVGLALLGVLLISIFMAALNPAIYFAGIFTSIGLSFMGFAL
ncbi:MAG: DUF1700 domain-containing protein, partial [Pseudobdellovibrio sp.]